MVVRDCWLTQDSEAAGFTDITAIEKIDQQGDDSVQCWIDAELIEFSYPAVVNRYGTELKRASRMVTGCWNWISS